MGVSKKTKAQTDILSILNQFERSEAIRIIEKIGMNLRKANSVEIAKEVEQFTIKSGTKKKIDQYPT